MNDDDFDGILDTWAEEVRAALGIDAEVDVKAVLGLAGVAAHAVVRPAAPLTTYLVGFVAGRAAERGEDPVAAAAEATDRGDVRARSDEHVLHPELLLRDQDREAGIATLERRSARVLTEQELRDLHRLAP